MTNKKSLYDSLSQILALAFIAVSFYALYKAVIWLSASISQVEPSLIAGLITAAGTVISSVFIASRNSRAAKERIAFEASRIEKAAIYNEFVEFLAKLMSNNDDDSPNVDENEAEKFLRKFFPKIIVCAGPKVVKSICRWRSTATRSNTAEQALMIDQIIRNMRDDLGEDNSSIQSFELIGLFIKPDEVHLLAQDEKVKAAA